ncbi:MAG: OmpA family protein [Rikenellaceae bacterium]
MKRLLFTLLFLVSSIIVHAQVEIDETLNEDERIYWSTWNSNWFVSAAVGVEAKFFKEPIEGFELNPVPTYTFSVGKWIFPFVGLRLQYNESAIRGVCEPTNLFVDSERNLVGGLSVIHADAKFNLNAIINGYKEDRFYEIYPFLGVGMSVSHGNGRHYEKDYPVFGLINRFRINNGLSLKCEIRSSIACAGHYGIEEVYQRKRIYPVSACIGLIYRFKPRGYKKVEPIVVEKYVERVVVDTVKVVKNIVDTVEIVKNVVDTVKIVERNPEVEKIVEVEKEQLFAGSIIHFDINSSTLSQTARINIDFIARVIKSNESDKIFTVVGYADAQTGTPEINEKLSKARVEAVYNCLVEEYGVDKSRLKMDYKGGVGNMFFEDNTLSRAVIVQ